MTDDLLGGNEGADPSLFEPVDAKGADTIGTDAPGNILQNLRLLPLFELLSNEEFRIVVRLLRTQQVPRGLLVIEQGAINHRLYVIRRGRAVVRVIGSDDVERRTAIIQIGQVFNENSFLTGARNAETIEALEDLTLWYIDRDEFHLLLKEYPQIEARVTEPPVEVVEDTQRVVREESRYAWQRKNEHVVLYRKKHVIVFIESLWPVTIAVVALFLLLLPPVVAFLGQYQQTMMLAVFFLTAVGLVLQLVNWQNDYYAITDQRVLHRERDLLIRDEQDEIPLTRVQDVKIKRSSLFATMLNIGDITIEASGSRSRIRFENISNPDEVLAILNGQLDRARVAYHATQRAHIRLDLRRELGLAPPVPVVQKTAPPIRTVTPRINYGINPKILRQQLEMVRNTLLPRLRLVKGTDIIYRKHWLQLLESISTPALLSVLYFGLLLLIRMSSDSLSELIFTYPIVIAVVVIGFGLLFGLVYQYEDWRNDIYILTPERLIDIYRSPFALSGMSRQDAKLENIQDVRSVTHGVLDNLFNVGDVIIQTAGAEGKLTFERVYNPRQVQRDILDRRDAFETTQREKEATQRRKEMTEWLGIYNELTRLHDLGKLG
ncbi:MAG TPA: PH domain-containing protein [Anaerolineae bacterium]